MKSTKKAFTVVELIVVITILAILGTIAFISLGSYTGDARNAKRTDAVSKIATSIENALIDGKAAASFAADNTSALTSIAVNGVTGASVTGYQAGEANYTALNIKAEDFKDPSNDASYVVGATGSNQYEVAAALETNGAKEARVMGNWSPRTVVSSTATGAIDGNTFVIASGSDINKIRKGDTVDIGTGTDLVVQKVSRDGLTLTFTDLTSATGTEVALAEAESDGLIGSEADLAVAVIEGGAALPY